MTDPIPEVFRQGTCAYCGAVSDVTNDHVIPQCLWGRVRGAPKSAPIVDACRQCNHIWKSEYDTYLRDLLVTDRNASQSPIVQKILPKFNRSVDTNRSIMAHDFRDQAKVVEVQRPSGIHVLGLVADVAEERTREIMSLIVRGLHQYYLHNVLPKNTSFNVIRVYTQEQYDELIQNIRRFGGREERVDNGEVFECSFSQSLTSFYPYTSIWELNFFHRVVFAVATNFLIREGIS